MPAHLRGPSSAAATCRNARLTAGMLSVALRVSDPSTMLRTPCDNSDALPDNADGLGSGPSGLASFRTNGMVWSWLDHDADLYRGLRRDQVLNSVTLHWQRRRRGASPTDDDGRPATCPVRRGTVRTRHARAAWRDAVAGARDREAARRRAADARSDSALDPLRELDSAYSPVFSPI